MKLGFGALNALSVSSLFLDKNSIKIYPSPSKGKFTLSNKNGIIGKVTIFDARGQLLRTEYLELKEADIDISNFSKGIYILRSNQSVNRIVLN